MLTSLAPIFPLATALALLATSITGCSETPVDASGSYRISVTNAENDCELEGWSVGTTSLDIALDVSQEGEFADAALGGEVGNYQDLVLGGHLLSGEVRGNRLEQGLSGTRETQSLGCAFFVDSFLDARLNDDLLEGVLIYTVNDNGSPDCNQLQGCQSVQDFNGTR